MTNEARMIKCRINDREPRFRHLNFDIPSCFAIRHSPFHSYDHWFCWRRANGREHGAAFEGPIRLRRTRHRRLRYKRKAATGLAAELGCAPAQDLSDVT